MRDVAPAEVDPALLVEGDLGARERPAIVHAATRGLAHAVARQDPHPRRPPCAQPGGVAAPRPDDHGVVDAQGLAAARVVEEPDELGRHEARVAAAPGSSRAVASAKTRGGKP